MTASAVRQRLTLEEFLAMPETKPASEFINGKIEQKPMPQGEHSRLQSKLCGALNDVGEPAKIAMACPELRCIFGERALVPDLSVFRWQRIPRTDSGRIANRFELHPDWAIEIVSPGQSHTKVLDNLLHCSANGTELGWLIDSDEESILVVDESQRLRIFRGEAIAPTLPELNFSMTAQQIFSWLML
jgi:Uma2 family endonuclease